MSARHRLLGRLLRGASITAVFATLVAGTAVAAQAALPSGTPVGNLDGVTAVAGGVRVRGWVWDPNTTQPVTVTIVAGATTQKTTATVYRPDVPKVYPAAGSYRGFDLVVPVASGPQRVCVTATNVGAGINRAFTCVTVTVPSGSPSGAVEAVTEVEGGLRVQGWAADRSITAPIGVRLAIGGTTQVVTADEPRPDVALLVPGIEQTVGFDVVVPLATGSYQLCATALNVGLGADTSLGCTPAVVRDHAPHGAVDPATDDASGGLRVTGWASDVDAAALTVRLAVTGSTVTQDVTADQARDGQAQATGFGAVLPLAPGTYEVCATAVNAGFGSDAALGCTTATVLDHAPSGALDPASDAAEGGLRLSGWAADIDAAALTVRYEVTGTDVVGTVLAGASLVSDGAATTAAGDEPVADPAPAQRALTGRFDTVVPLAPGTYEVCATAVNAGPGADTALGCTTATVLDHRPYGNLDGVLAVEGGVRVRGWAADPDTSDPLAISVAAAGATRTLTTGVARADVPKAFPSAGGSTGFDAVVPLAAGTHQVCVTVVNAGPGADKVFTCRTVTVAAPVPVPTPTPTPTPTPSPSPSPSPTVPAQPGATNTGVPAGTALTVHEGDLVITTPGAVITGLDVHGFIDIQAAGVVIRNTVVRGREVTVSRGLVTVGSSAYSLTIEDSELASSVLSPYIDGLRGMNITARRVNIHDVVDSVHIYGSNVTIEGSWLHDNTHFLNDPNWNGGPSHDDNIQIQIGDSITIRNNTINGSKNAAIMLTQDRGLVSHLRIEDNWLDGGACTVNVKNQPTAPVDVALWDNSFGRNAQYPTCGIKMPNTSYLLDLQRNVYTDGVPVTVTR